MDPIVVAVFCGLGVFVLGALLSKRAFFVNLYSNKDALALSHSHTKAQRISKIALVFSLLSPIPLGLFFDAVKSSGAVNVLLPVSILLVMVFVEVFWLGRHVASVTKKLLEELSGRDARGAEGGGGSEENNL